MIRKGIAHDRKQRSWAFGMVLTIPLILVSQLGWADKLTVDSKRGAPAQRSVYSAHSFSGPGKPLEALVNSATNRTPASLWGIDSVNSGAPLQDSIPPALDSVETPEQDTIGKLDMTDTIEAVWVQAYRPISKMDATKQVFKFDPTGLSPTASAHEAIRFTPGVAEIKGSFRLLEYEKRAKILIDGVESKMERLNTLTATMVDRIEVIPYTTDNDKYGGAINVVLKQVKTGKHWAKIPFMYLVRTQGPGLGPSYVFRNKKMDLYVYGGYRFNSKGHLQEWDFLPDKRWTEGAYTIRQQNYNSHVYSAITEYNLKILKNLLLTLGYSVQGSNGPRDIEYKSYGNAPQHYNELRGTALQQYVTTNLRYMALPWMHFVLRGLYFDYRDWGEMIFNTKREEQMRIMAGELEILHPKLKTWAITHTLQEGYQLNVRDINTGSAPGKAYIHRFFMADAVNIAPWLSLYAMLKIDWDSYQVEGFTSRNIVPLPMVMLSSPSRMGNLRLIFERSAGRPDVSFLVPRTIVSPDGTKITGNPYLDNQTSNRLTLSYGKQIMNHYLSLFSSYTQIYDIIDATHTSPTARTYENVGRGNFAKLGGGISLMFLNKTLRINLNAAAVHKHFSIKEEFLNRTISIGNKGWGGFASASINYRDPWKISWKLNAQYTPRTIFLNRIEMQEEPTLYFSIERNFFNNMLTITLSYLNMFGLGERTAQDFLFSTGTYQKNQRFHGQDIGLNVTLNIGKRVQRRNFGAKIRNDDLIKGEHME